MLGLRLTRASSIKIAIGAAVFALAAIGLAVWLIVTRAPNTYYPYLPTTRAVAFERIKTLSGGRLDCDAVNDPAPRPGDTIFTRGIGGHRGVVGTCSDSNKVVVASLYGDHPNYVYWVSVEAHPNLSARSRRAIATIAAAAAGGLPQDVIDKASVSDGGDGFPGEVFASDRSEIHVSRVAGHWLFDVHSEDSEWGPRLRSTHHRVDPERLARTFAPVFHLAPGERFKPLALDALKGVASLCEKVNERVVPETCKPLRRFPTTKPCRSSPCKREWVIDLPPGEYQAKRYEEIEEEIRRGRYRQPVVYWHVANVGHRRILSYWLYYAYNRFANIHEGDWETVQVDLRGTDGTDRIGVARWFFSSHSGGDTESCEEIPSDCRNPDVFVARGSHANYFTPGDHKAVADCPVGYRCVTSPTPDVTRRSDDPLELGDYKLVELKEPAYVVRYGRENMKSGLLRFTLLPWPKDGPNDPRVRDSWSKAPLAPFEEAVGSEPDAREWRRFDIEK